MREERDAIGLAAFGVDRNVRRGLRLHPVRIRRAFPNMFSVSLLHNARQNAPIKIDGL